MLRHLYSWFCLSVLCVLSAHTVADVQPQNGSVVPETMTLQSLNNMPLTFTQNKGQWPDSIQYRANAGGATMWFTPNGAYYQFTRKIPKAESGEADLAAGLGPRLPDLADRISHERDRVETMMIKASFVGCNPKPELVGDEQLGYKSNYFLGNDRSKWRTDVPNYSSVTYKDVYSGIDLKYYGDDRKMEYDFIVEAGADYSQIKIRYEGAKSLTVNANGDLVIETGFGTVTEKAPVVYQLEGKTRKRIPAAYSIVDGHSFGFSLGSEYNCTLPVIIDPVLSYSTYLGGSGYDWSYDVAVDGAGSAYVTGHTTSSDFPVISQYDGSLASYQDVFVTKMSPSGTSLVYSTYLGGDYDDFGYGIAVDGAGSAYVTGRTGSDDFPMVNPFDGVCNFDYDAFVTKLSPTGNSLVYSTYLGSNSGSEDYGYAIAVDGVGSAYVTGTTPGWDFPTFNPFASSNSGGYDAFVTKFSPAGNTLLYSTYIGGGGGETGRCIAVDGAGSAYVTGETYSPNFPTANRLDGTYNGGTNDAFVTKLNPSGNALLYSTYLGGAKEDRAFGIAVDGSGRAYVTGRTFSSDFPTVTPFDGGLTGTVDAFVAKLSSAGSSLIYSSYLGGGGEDYGWDIAVDTAGSTYLTGWTLSSDFPTASAFGGFKTGYQNAFVTKLSPAGGALVYSSYLGGSISDNGYGISVDALGNAYVTGATYSSDFPTVTPFDAILNGMIDAFVTKVSPQAYCCIGTTGNTDGSGDDVVDISDVFAVVDYLGASIPLSTCVQENDVNKDGPVDISDLFAVIDYLSGAAPLPVCP